MIGVYSPIQRWRTMHYRTLTPIFVITLALAAGCGGGGEDTFADKYNALDAEIQSQVEFQCDCYANFFDPYPSREACIQQRYEPADPAVGQCLINAAETDLAASNARIDCVLVALREYTTCMDVVLDCNDLMNTFLQCDGELTAAIGQCPALPTAVQDANAACFPQQ
jgi:hypothetical protein